MEVHHHSSAKKEKHLKHYLFDFMMLFLAVSAGFLVENFREHYVEGQRERTFIKSFIEDLKQDTLKINANINLRNSKIAVMDSLMILLNSADPNSDGRSVYYFGRRVTRSTLFQSNDGTIKQLKNAGGFRLIKKQKAASVIMAYDHAIEYINYLQIREAQELTQLYPFLAKMYDGYVLETMIHGNEINRPEGNPRLRTTDRNLLLDFIYLLHQYKSTSVVAIARLLTVKQTASETIEILKKEYHLK